MLATNDGNHDPLTGALSRMAFQPALDHAFQEARQAGLPLALCIIDVDHFKSINDAFGHMRGDEVVATVGARLRTGHRHADGLYRYGGDEFVLLLPDTTQAQALVLAERLLAAMRATPCPGQPPLSLTLSIGIGTLNAEHDTPRALFEQADRRLYEAKRRGRNQMVADDTSVSGRLTFDAGSRLIEREAALHTLQGFLAELAHDGLGTLAVRGPAGSGKTRLLAEAAALAIQRGYAVVPLAARPALRSRLYGVLAEAAAQWPELGNVSHTTESYCKALWHGMFARGSQGLVIVIDDLPDLDRASLAVVRALLAGPRPGTVGLISSATQPSAVAAGLGMSGSAEVVLATFSPAGTARWLRGVLSWEAPTALVDWLQVESGGLPGRLRHLITTLLETKTLLPTADGWELDRAVESLEIGPRQPAGPPRLPGAVGAFVGRIREIQELKDLLEEPGLVCVLGPGGVGKTRLAMQAAEEIAHRYTDGVAFVPLASLEDAARLPETLATALSLPAAQVDLVGALMEYLAARELLLVLDGAEYLPSAIDQLVSLRTAAPRLHILVTSREPLQVPGVRTLRVDGFAALDALEPARTEAVQLFIGRAQERNRAWQVPVDLEPIQRICRLVEGMPLGIELAASWAGELTPEELADALAGSLDLLGGAPAARRESHGLDAAISYFWGTLSPYEQGVLRALSVFRGGFTRPAAATVAGASLFLLTALVERSFLRREAGGRYHLHEVLRQYAATALGAHDAERAGVRERHAAYFLALANEAMPLLRGPQQGEWLARLESERDNLRAALHWTRSGGEPAVGLQLAAALWRFWYMRGHLSEGRSELDAWLAPAGDDPEIYDTNADLAAARAAALLGAGVLAESQGDLNQATALYERSLTRQRVLGDRREVAITLNNLGAAILNQGDVTRATVLLDESLRILGDVGERWGLAIALGSRGEAALRQGDYAQATALFTESLALRRELEDKRGVAVALNNLGTSVLKQGDCTRASDLLRESLALRCELGDQRGQSYALHSLGELALQVGKAGCARKYLAESITLARTVGDKLQLAVCLETMAQVAQLCGQLEQAVQLNGAARTLREAVGAPRTPSDSDAYEDIMAAASATLGETAAAEAWAAGRALPQDQAISLALRVVAD